MLNGNAVPHLHYHIKPRSYGDATPGTPFPLHEHRLLLAPHEYEERVRLIRDALAAQEEDERTSAEPPSRPSTQRKTHMRRYARLADVGSNLQSIH
jgi:hypothetical protein